MLAMDVISLRVRAHATRCIALAITAGLALPARAAAQEPPAPAAVGATESGSTADPFAAASPSDAPTETAAPAPTPAQPEPAAAPAEWSAPSPAPPEPVPAPAPVVAPTTNAPDPWLVERNLKLSKQMQSGERKLIIGRVTAGIGAALMMIGGVMFIVAAVRQKTDEALSDEAPDKPVGLWAGGGVLMGLGAAGVATGAVFWVRGSRIVKAANRGELLVRVRPGGLTVRF